jgi:hypothetical protein
MTSARIAAAAATIMTMVSAPIVTTPQARIEPVVAAAQGACDPTSKALTPLSGYSLHLGRFDGTVYYTVAEHGYRVVATFVSGSDELPIRFVATLADGQDVTLSVPQGPGEPSIDLGITRAEDALIMGNASPCSPTN